MNLTTLDFNMLDAGLALVLILFLFRGLLRGMIREIAGFVGVILAILLAGKFYHLLIPHADRLIGNENWSAAVSYIVLFALVLVLVSLATMVLHKFLSMTFTSWLNHLLGAVTGAAKGLLLCAVGIAILERLVPDSLFLKSSILARQIEQLTVMVREYLPSFL